MLPVERETSTRFACSESLLLSNVQNNFVEVKGLWIIGSALEAKRLESHVLFVSQSVLKTISENIKCVDVCVLCCINRQFGITQESGQTLSEKQKNNNNNNNNIIINNN